MSVLRDTTIPPIEPVTLEQAKLHVRSDAPEDDALLMRLIVAARQEVENITGRTLSRSRWKVDFHASTTTAHFPLVPCLSLESVCVDGIEIDPILYTFTPASVGGWAGYPQFVKLDGFPVGSVDFIVLAGYGDDCPEPLRQWMLTRIGTWFEQREGIAVGANFTEFGRGFVDSLLDPYILPAKF